MKIDLAVIGAGAVSPGGIGVAALNHQPSPSQAASLSRPNQTWPVLRVDPKSPELLRWNSEPRLRRSSPITLYLLEAAEQALATISPEDRAQAGLIVALSAGCVAYSRRFFEGFLRDGRNRASPALFPETVFNSPASHVAASLKLNGAVYALVGDETAWVAAINTASIWLRNRRVNQVLVLGAEEYDTLVLDAYQSARWLRRKSSSPFMASEGAGGVLLRIAEPGDTQVIAGARDGFIYRTPRQAAAAMREVLRDLDPSQPCYRSAQRTWLGSLEEKMLEGRPTRGSDAPYLGNAFTASAAWNTLRALAQLSGEVPSIALPVWGLNHQFGFLELANRA